MRRRLFNLAAAVSLALCICGGAAWVYSHLTGLHLAYHKRALTSSGYDETERDVYLLNGAIFIRSSEHWNLRIVESWHPPEGWRVDDGFSARGSGYPRLNQGWQFVGFAFDRRLSSMSRQVQVIVPMWFVLAALSVLPASRFRQIMRDRRGRRRSQHRTCTNCGYDLRATPDRCPECGTAVSPRRRVPPPPVG